jgi:glycine cleavage system regulatory protein
MRSALVVTIIGDDRPGIVERVSELVLEADANWEESRMARLAGKFAGILRVSVVTRKAAALGDALLGLEAHGLKVVVERSAGDDQEAYRTVALEIVGNDRPGIVRDIASLLAGRGVNIEELDTELTSAPDTGDTLFQARARLRTPPDVAIEELQQLLESLAADLMVDLAFESAISNP